MKTLEKYHVYVSSHCKDCLSVVNYIETQDIKCEVLNIDSNGTDMPDNLFVIPALISGEKILAYGQRDIISVLDRA